MAFLTQRAFVVEQPDAGSKRSIDLGDDYLLALAEHHRAVLSPAIRTCSRSRRSFRS